MRSVVVPGSVLSMECVIELIVFLCLKVSGYLAEMKDQEEEEKKGPYSTERNSHLRNLYSSALTVF